MTKKEQLEQIEYINGNDIYCRRLPLGRTRVLKTPVPGVDPTGRANENPLKQPMMVMQNVSKQPLTKVVSIEDLIHYF
jgi:hypothetical protein